MASWLEWWPLHLLSPVSKNLSFWISNWFYIEFMKFWIHTYRTWLAICPQTSCLQWKYDTASTNPIVLNKSCRAAQNLVLLWADSCAINSLVMSLLGIGHTAKLIGLPVCFLRYLDQLFIKFHWHKQHKIDTYLFWISFESLCGIAKAFLIASMSRCLQFYRSRRLIVERRVASGSTLSHML